MSADKEEYILKYESDYHPNPKGIGYELFEAMKRYRHKTAQIEGETGKTETYETLLKHAIRLALRLKEKNLQKTDIISVCSTNHLNISLPFIAASFLYVRFSPLDPTFTVNDFKYFLNLLKPRILFVIPDVQEKVQIALKEVQSNTEVILFDDTFQKYLEKHQDENNFEPVIPDSFKDTWGIYFSSGSTGMPKGICLSQYSLMSQMLNTIKYGKMGNKLVLTNYTTDIGGVDTVFLYYSPLYWITATMFALSVVVTGTTRVIYKKFDPEEFWTALDKYEVTNVFTSATMLSEIALKVNVLKSNKLITLQAGGARVSKHHLIKLRKFLPNILISQCYGQTEIGGYISCPVPDDIHVDPDSCGRTIGSFSFRVVEPETNQVLPLTEPGELRIKTPYIFNGYYNSDSSLAFDEDGWFKTGDIVRFDEKRYLYHIRRCKDLLKYKGYHLAPVLLEQILLQHPTVKEAVVVGLHDEIDGDHPAAVITLRDKTDAEEIRRFVDDRVNDISKLRGGVRIVDDFPLTAAGKVNRLLIQKMINSGQL